MSLESEGSWAEARAHLLAQPMTAALREWIESDSPYRPAYVSAPLRRQASALPEPWKELREQNSFVWGAATNVELCLAWLVREFGSCPSGLAGLGVAGQGRARRGVADRGVV